MLASQDIVRLARAAGFHLAGLARASLLDGAALQRWLGLGMAGAMGWMGERRDERLDPRKLFPEARTVVALGCCVRTRAHDPCSAIAQYAQGRDYHATMRDRLRSLRASLRELAPGISDYAEVDTGPVLERAWAERAGLGWVGKNGMLISPEHGSQVVLAVMLLSEEADRYHEPAPGRCGTCEACLTGCPTRAIVAPGVVDSRLCLSYQTIEDHAEFAPALRPHARLAFGCDACQSVCPWNAPDHACDDARFLPRAIAGQSLLQLATLTRERFDELTRGTAVARSRFEGLRRNALTALGAAHDPRIFEASALAADPDPHVRAAARWALEQVPRP